MYRLLTSASILALACTAGTAASAQGAPQESSYRLDEVVVTATKRTTSLQDTAVTVAAIGAQELDQLGVSTFTDYLVQLPGVTAGGSGPGQSTIYIRGLASTTPNLTTAGVAGLAPNVAFYLDEQPLAQPGRNLDVYAADLQRVEVLSGPQGTLFGASSQAGTVRLITNKPSFSGFDANLKASTSFTEGGEMSNSVEAMINVTVSDKLAVRGVIYSDNQGGYIDNVAGTRDASESGRFRPAGTVRSNGVVVSPARGGFSAGSDLDGVTFLEANNSNLVEDDFNDTSYAGFRVSALYDVNDDWSVLLTHAQQQLDTDGVFFSDPELDDYEIQRFSDDSVEDSFHNTSWTVDGKVGALEALYTGAYTERTTDQNVDYSDYLFVGQYIPYYICDAAAVYPSYTAAGGPPTGTCQSPELSVKSNTEVKVQTHELRFNTPAENKLRATFGGFYSDLELAEFNDFTYPGSVNTLGVDGVTTGFYPNYALTNAAASGAVGNASNGYYSDAGAFPEGVIFRNDVLRTDQQMGVFGEATYDFTDQVSLTLGARYYDVEVDIEGSANSSFYNRRSAVYNPNAALPAGTGADAQLGGTNISAQFASDNTVGAPDKAATDGFIFKATGTWTPTDDVLLYATYSEGFRPGLLNRPGGTVVSAAYTVPFALETDDVQNYEFGWKTELLDNSLRVNGSAFFVEIENLQTTIFDPSISNLFFSDNAANAEIKGIEGDFTWAPYSIDGLTIAGAFSLLDTEITDVLTPTGDVLVGSELAFAPSYQGNLRARYEWELETEVAGSQLTAHVMPQIIFSDEAYSDIIEINKAKTDGYMTLGTTLGVTADQWSAELFATNLTNEYVELSNNFVFDRERVNPMRPRTVGVRVGYNY